MNVDLKLSVYLEPIHATWLVETSQYKFFTRAPGRVHVLKGWQKVGIKGVLSITASVSLPMKCKLCVTQKRKIKVIQNIKFPQNRET